MIPRRSYGPGVLTWMGLFLSCSLSAVDLGGQERVCGEGVGVVRGQVVTPDGLGLGGQRIELRDDWRCWVSTDDQGAFILLGLPLDSVTVWPREGSHCMVPRRVLAEPDGSPVVFQAIRMPQPFDDSFFLVEHIPYVPPTHEQLRYVDATRLFFAGEEPVSAIPDPEEVLTGAFQMEEVEVLMATAAEEQTPIPLAFHYGPLRDPLPQASHPYVLDPGPLERRSGIYVAVLQADSDIVVAQVGRRFVPEEDPWKNPTEAGLRVEWRRAGGEWGQGVVTDRWTPPPLR